MASPLRGCRVLSISYLDGLAMHRILPKTSKPMFGRLEHANDLHNHRGKTPDTPLGTIHDAALVRLPFISLFALHSLHQSELNRGSCDAILADKWILEDSRACLLPRHTGKAFTCSRAHATWSITSPSPPWHFPSAVSRLSPLETYLARRRVSAYGS